MALSAPRRCRTCRQLVRGKCETCDAAWIRKPKSWTVANTGDRRWRRIRQVRLALEPLCRFCGAIATTVDPNTSTAALKGSTEEGQFH